MWFFCNAVPPSGNSCIVVDLVHEYVVYVRGLFSERARVALAPRGRVLVLETLILASLQPIADGTALTLAKKSCFRQHHHPLILFVFPSKQIQQMFHFALLDSGPIIHVNQARSIKQRPSRTKEKQCSERLAEEFSPIPLHHGPRGDWPNDPRTQQSPSIWRRTRSSRCHTTTTIRGPGANDDDLSGGVVVFVLPCLAFPTRGWQSQIEILCKWLWQWGPVFFSSGRFTTCHGVRRGCGVDTRGEGDHHCFSHNLGLRLRGGIPKVTA